jgi:hypothetical protein
MELTDKQKHDLRRFSLILNSLNMEDGVEYVYRHYDEWEGYEPEGPYYRNQNVKSEIDFIPGSIGPLFEEIKDNFDTDLFYNDYYDNYNGGLNLIVNAEKKMLVVKYYYYTMITEDSRIERSFKDLSETTNPWRRGEEEVKKLTNEDFLNRMKEEYGSYVRMSYDGSGDSGWIQDQVDSEKGSKGSTNELENIAYEVLEIFHAGWEINEGSSGTMVFNFDDQTFTVEHYQNIEDEAEDFYKSFSFA